MKLKTFEAFADTLGYTIYCDMDGVLTDFEKRFRDINPGGLSPKEFDEANGKFSMWHEIDKHGIKWWSNMEWMPDGKKLWSYISKFNPTILSAPSRAPESKLGKMVWLKKNLHISQDPTLSPKKSRWDPNSRVILNSEKHLFVRGPKDILIDDTMSKIQNWRGAGGIAIHHTSTSKTMSELKKLGL